MCFSCYDRPTGREEARAHVPSGMAAEGDFAEESQLEAPLRFARAATTEWALRALCVLSIELTAV
jgi:hypothetical protein